MSNVRIVQCFHAVGRLASILPDILRVQTACCIEMFKHAWLVENSNHTNNTCIEPRHRHGVNSRPKSISFVSSDKQIRQNGCPLNKDISRTRRTLFCVVADPRKSLLVGITESVSISSSSFGSQSSSPIKTTSLRNTLLGAWDMEGT
jgi:hypothetical protein